MDCTTCVHTWNVLTGFSDSSTAEKINKTNLKEECVEKHVAGKTGEDIITFHLHIDETLRNKKKYQRKLAKRNIKSLITNNLLNVNVLNSLFKRYRMPK